MQPDPEPIPPPQTTEESREPLLTSEGELPPAVTCQPEPKNKWPARNLAPKRGAPEQSNQGGEPVSSLAEGILVEIQTED